MTPAQAATQAYTQDSITTIADGQTLDSIATANNTSVPDILRSNPDLRSPQTGVVINLPRPGSDAWRAQNINQAGGIGLPSNAALGETSYNQLGINSMRGRGTNRNASLPGYTAPTMGYTPYNASNFSTGNNVPPLLASNNFGGSGTTPYGPPAPGGYQAQPNNTTPPPGAYMQQYQYMSRNLFHQQIRTKVDTAGYVPTSGELNILEKMGFIKKDQTSRGGGRGYSRGRGGGGRGGGSGGGGGGGGVSREPAFSSGSGSFGLVNWRI